MAALDGPSTKLGPFLSRRLNNLLTSVEAHLKDTTTFLSFLEIINTAEITGFASLDVCSLYPSVPRYVDSNNNDKDVFVVTNEFLSIFAKDNEISSQITEQDILNLIHLALDEDYVLHQGKTYKQTNGLSMGNALAPQIAIIYINYIESEIKN